jgi:2-polyprenyl-3-methyl-5-hydroxy-6-metoxy-1,4-benzoquinol methylase
MSVLNSLHGGIVHTRRVRVLSQRVAPMFPQGASVLDAGCGDGLVAKLISQERPDLTLDGIDVLIRPPSPQRPSHRCHRQPHHQIGHR